MKTILTLLIAALTSLPASGEEKTTPVMWKNAALHYLMRNYELWSGCKVWLAAGVDASITIEHPEQVPFAKAAEIVRKTLLENYGISIRETEKKEAFVEWTDDPKYKDRRLNPIPDWHLSLARGECAEISAENQPKTYL